jgi:hypothetical protein
MARFLLSALSVIALVFSAIITITPALGRQHQSLIQPERSQQNRLLEERPKPGPSASSVQEKRFALVIGNGAYVGANLLRNPPNDARAMSASLREIGFDVVERINLNSREMKKAIIDLGNKLKTNDVGLFYYAGHGVQSNGKNYLIPVDAEIEKEADIVVDGVELDTVMAQIEGAKNRISIVILDACRNDFSTRSWRSQGRGLAQVANAPSGTFIAYATAPGSTASDNKSGQNGLYTQELLKALRQPGLRIEEVFKQVRLRVRELSNGQQIPWESSSLEGEFYFIPTNSTVASSNTSNPPGGHTDNSPTTPAASADTLKNKPNNAINTDSNSIPPPINPGRNWDSIQRKIDARLYDDAIREGLDYLESHPNDPQLNWLLGLVHLKNKLFPVGYRYISKAFEGGMPLIFSIIKHERNGWRHGTLKVHKDGIEIQLDKTITQNTYDDKKGVWKEKKSMANEDLEIEFATKVPYNLVREISRVSDILKPIRLKVGINQNNQIKEKEYKFSVSLLNNFSLDDVVEIDVDSFKTNKGWDYYLVIIINDLKAKSQ